VSAFLVTARIIVLILAVGVLVVVVVVLRLKDLRPPRGLPLLLLLRLRGLVIVARAGVLTTVVSEVVVVL